MIAVLADLCEAIVDCEHKTAPRGDGFAMLVGTRAMKDGRLLTNACKPVSANTYETWTKRMRPRLGDLVLAREAPVGQVVRVPVDLRICLGQRTVLIRPATTKVHPRFLHYWLLSPSAQNLMKGRAAGATVPHLNVEDIRALDVSTLPDDPQLQNFAASALGALDDMIENNRRRIELLEQMAQAIYREWFVHFRYPGHEDATLVYSPLGPIPEGWRTIRLDEVATVNKASRKPASGKRLRYLDISCLGDRSIGLPLAMDGSNAPGRARRAVRCGDIVWSMVRPGRRAHALLVQPGADWVASTGLAVITPEQISPSLLFEILSSPQFSDYLVSQEGGSAYPAVKPKDFEAAMLLMPRADIEERFDEAIRPHHQAVWVLREESRKLAAIRDLLLPKLVTGEIDVSHLDLDSVVGSVA